MKARLEAWLARHTSKDRLVPLNYSELTSDSTEKFVLKNASGRRVGFLLCSSRTSPLLVGRGVDRAQAARDALGDELAQVIPDPSEVDVVDGVSIAVFPFYRPLSTNRWIRAVQRRALSAPLLDWLREATQKTVAEAREADIAVRWEPALNRMREEKFATELAAAALAQLREGRWWPKYVLAHNDLWIGNVLYAPRGSRWPFVIIDWLGSDPKGHAIFDLIRLASSLGLSAGTLRSEIDSHCSILECDRARAGIHLLAALGRVGMNLEQFPRERFTAMAESCWRTFTAACAR